MKRYDRTYFDRWYRNPRHQIGRPSDLRRKVRLSVSVTEVVLGRPVRSVLDVGSGEGRWQPVLRRLRPKATYAGVDSSRYAVGRYGRRRNIRLGSLGTLDPAEFDGPYDLVVCSDVLHYVPTAEVRRGLDALAQLMGGVAFIEVFTANDDLVGDRAGFARRSAAFYRRAFAEAGLVACGMHCYTTRALARDLVELERLSCRGPRAHR